MLLDLQYAAKKQGERGKDKCRSDYLEADWKLKKNQGLKDKGVQPLAEEEE